MYDTLTAQFNETIAREGKTITSYTGNTYNCVFRKNSDKNSSDNRLTIYYAATDNITQGQLLKYNNNYFLALNKETDENEVYQKSDLLEVNTEIHTIVSGYELYIKVYAEDVSSVGVTGNSTITTVGGNVNFIAQDDANSRRLAINATFTALGAAWKIINIFYKSGLCYIYTERTTSSTTTPTYALAIAASDSYTIGDTPTLTAAATITDNGTTTTIVNPTIAWTTSNNDIATITSTGVLTAVAEGTVTLTAVWVEHGTTATKSITIKSNVVLTYVASIPETTRAIRAGSSFTYTAVFKDSTGATVSLTPVWTLGLPADCNGQVTLTYPASNTTKVAVANNEDIVGYKFTLTLKDSNNLCSTSITIEIT